jgi:4-aminobutyrate aminotransferase-like enzyme
MIRIELVKDKKSREPLPKDICREIFDECLKSGLLTMGYNPSVRINPPLCLTLEQALRGAEILERSLLKVAKRHGA